MNWNSLNKIISSSKNIILSTHVNPDGDGIGSELGMYYYLKDIGKQCTIINVSKTPVFLDFIDPEAIIEMCRAVSACRAVVPIQRNRLLCFVRVRLG